MRSSYYPVRKAREKDRELKTYAMKWRLIRGFPYIKGEYARWFRIHVSKRGKIIQ